MKYNKKYIDIKYGLMRSFMLDMEENILDISYGYDINSINIQIVLLYGTTLSNNIKNRLFENLNEFEIVISEVFISKTNFNDNKGIWQPKHYTWLPNLLFSKAEVL